MEKILNLISAQVCAAFEAAGYDASYGRVTVSNRPDLCEYQCNGALAAAKAYHKAPIQIANDVAALLGKSELFADVQAAMPGFLNLKLNPAWLADYLEQVRTAERFGVEPDPEAGTVVIDYGGPNVAKPLHIGHLRSAIIGESIKRIQRFFGSEAIGDIHLGHQADPAVLRQRGHRRHPPGRLGPADGSDHCRAPRPAAGALLL